MKIKSVIAAIAISCLGASIVHAEESTQSAPTFRLVVHPHDQPGSIVFDQIVTPQGCSEKKDSRGAVQCVESQLSELRILDKDGAEWPFKVTIKSGNMKSEDRSALVIYFNSVFLIGIETDANGMKFPNARKTEFVTSTALKAGQTVNNTIIVDSNINNHDAGVFHPAQNYDMQVTRLR